MEWIDPDDLPVLDVHFHCVCIGGDADKTQTFYNPFFFFIFALSISFISQASSLGSILKEKGVSYSKVLLSRLNPSQPPFTKGRGY
jgi:hypothetical protein